MVGLASDPAGRYSPSQNRLSPQDDSLIRSRWGPLFLLRGWPLRSSFESGLTGRGPQMANQVIAMNVTYNDAFYEETERGSEQAAQIILSRIRLLYPFSSVLDVGCGLGSWVRVARDLGVTRAVGVDGNYVPERMRRMAPADFVSQDLESPLATLGQFDLTVCLEVAEHLSPPRGPTFIADLVGTSDVIAFSAAIPFQGGDGHLNEAWPAYWGKLFEAHGYLAWDGLRREIWNLVDIPWWYRQNLLLFVRWSAWAPVLGERRPTSPADLCVVHPECYLWAARRASASFKTTLDQDVALYHQGQDGSVDSLPGYGPEFPAPAVYGRKIR